MIVFVIFENEKTIESFEKYDVLRLWLDRNYEREINRYVLECGVVFMTGKL